MHSWQAPLNFSWVFVLLIAGLLLPAGLLLLAAGAQGALQKQQAESPTLAFAP